jgi:hypothetical protein
MMTGTMTLLPPRAGLCQVCASDHEPELPHNAQSLYYQVSRQMQGLPCSWLTAMEHCAPEMQALWTTALQEKGVDVVGGGINPVRTKSKGRSA